MSPSSLSTERANGAHDPAAAPLFSRAADQASALAHRGLDAVRDTSTQLRDKAYRASEGTVGYIKDEPLKSIVIAAAAGAIVLGLIGLFSRIRDRY